MKLCLLIFSILIFTSVEAQTKHKILHFVDQDAQVPITSANIFKKPHQLIGTTDNNGNFEYFGRLTDADSLYVVAIGFEQMVLHIDTVSNYTIFNLLPSKTMLSAVVVTANNLNPYHAISQTDIRLRGVSNSQEVLRIVPGLFIGQPQGGGKAEQIFLRGFDNDHGTDINLSVDGMPINMVSHAHGQGYGDSHFIIPETIESTNYEKGMYNTSKGDLAVSGFAAFHTTNALDKNVIKVEGRQFNTYRALGMFSLLPKAMQDKQSWYVASEYRYSNAYFDHPQHFKRFNFFTKYTGQLSENNQLTISSSTMHSSWMASGQIPEVAVAEGLIGFYGAIDPNEGGITNRTNANAQLVTNLKNSAILKNQLYFSHYTFDLTSNFTYFLEDSINGDEIRQKEHRNLFGYNGSYSLDNYIGGIKLNSTLGWNTRWDFIRNISLSHTVNRYTIIDPLKLGNINEAQGDVYFNEEINFSPKWTLDLGIRYDYFHYQYDNQLASDTTLNGIGKYNAHNAVVSPKFKLSYLAGKDVQLYLFAGKGFHSNDARVVVLEGGKETLPAAYGSDLGIVAKPVKNLLLNAAVWYSYLQFDEKTLLEFKIDTDNDNKEDLVIQCVPKNGKMYVYGPVKPATVGGTTSTINSDANAEVNITPYASSTPTVATSSKGIKVFAGPRDDPFFFDLPQYLKIVSGQATSYNNPGTDALAGTNVLNVVVELPKSLLGTGSGINVWLETKQKS
ncbi:MAG: TonB-dependent receptor [Pseudopedobacter saltans]|uniref:TonB-dependent receptor n=1 Tax=Pseudopedobacter saltans TaxID=151895 RepID=A0A2W5F1Y2_9SPHI|nr:MAG: TonB-dependent receptor [Pseudopedobacter saltans]